MTMMMRFVSVLVAVVDCRLVVADLRCDCNKYYGGKCLVEDNDDGKCWLDALDAVFNDGENLLQGCRGWPRVSEDSLKNKYAYSLFEREREMRCLLIVVCAVRVCVQSLFT